MPVKILLPHRFKVIGAFITPVGLAAWVSGQLGVFDSFLNSINLKYPGIQIILITSFFSFLLGLYFISFAREKREDEYISQKRLESFQLAALFQLVFFIGSFLFMLVSKTEPAGESQMMLFLAFSILLFWIFYIIRFNYLLHWKQHTSNKDLWRIGYDRSGLKIKWHRQNWQIALVSPGKLFLQLKPLNTFHQLFWH